MGSLFGKPERKPESVVVRKPKTEITEKDRAILDLKNARDKIKKYRKKVCSEFNTAIILCLFLCFIS